jgi:hypothetical protein
VKEKKIKKPAPKVEEEEVEEAEEAEEVEEEDEEEEAPSTPPAALSMTTMLGYLFIVGGLVLVIVGLMYDVIKGDQFSMDTIGMMQWAIVGIGFVGLVLGFVLFVMGNKPAPAAKPSKMPAPSKKKVKRKKTKKV